MAKKTKRKKRSSVSSDMEKPLLIHVDMAKVMRAVSREIFGQMPRGKKFKDKKKASNKKACRRHKDEE